MRKTRQIPALGSDPVQWSSGVVVVALLIGTALGCRATRGGVLWRRRALAHRDAVVCVGVAARADGWGALHGHGLWAVWRLGWRNYGVPARREACCASRSSPLPPSSSSRSKRSSATNRRRCVDRHSGGGGYPLLVETLLPIVHDLNDPAGRDAMNLPAAGSAAERPLRSISRAPGRRHELPESLSAEEPAHHGGDAGLHQQRAVRVPQLAGRIAGRARQSVAAAQPRARRRRQSRSSPTPTR